MADTIVDALKKHLGTAFKGAGWDALLSAIAAGDQIVANNNRYAFDQLFRSTASGKYLYDRASDVGVSQPNNVGMSDELFRDFIIKTTAGKLTAQSIMEVLEIFYSSDAVRANVACTADEPVSLADGDDLIVAIDNVERHIVTFKTGSYKMSELAAVANRVFQLAGSKAYALSTVDPTTGKNKLKIYSGSLGLSGAIQITGGKAQNTLKFPTAIPTYTSTFDAPIWNVTVPIPGLATYTAVARTNQCIRSQEFDNGMWIKINAGTGVLPTVTANTHVAPDGTTTADTVVFNKGAGNAIGDYSLVECQQVASFSGTASIWMKTTDASTVVVHLGVYANNSGNVVTVTPNWQRFSVYNAGPAVGTVRFGLRGTFATATTASLAVWGGQLETGTVATPYIPTTTAAASAALPAGLIEAIPGDYANVYGTNFNVANRGSFEITDVVVDYPGPSVSFTVKNESAIAQTGAWQQNDADLLVFRPTKYTLNSLQRAAYVTQSEDSGFRLTLPVTTQVVNRTKNTGAYTQVNPSIDIASVIRDPYGALFVTTQTSHGLAVGDQVLIDGVQITPGTPGYGRIDGAYSVEYVMSSTVFVAQSGVLQNIETIPNSVNSWATKANTTTVANAALAPDGTMSASRVTLAGNNTGHYVLQNATGSFPTSGQVSAFSFYAKTETPNLTILPCLSNSVYVGFNSSTGGLAGGSFGSPVTYVVPVGNGWFRYSVFVTQGALADFWRGLVYFGTYGNYAATGAESALFWNVKLEIAKNGVGGKVTPLKASPCVIPGPYILDPEAGFAVTGIESTLSTDCTKYVSYSNLKVASTSAFPNSTGWLVLGFGTKYETGPVPYYGILDSTRLKIGSGFVFNKTVPAGAKVTYLAGKSPWVPAHPENTSLFYATDSNSGLVGAIETIESISAADSQITENIVYPGDRGLGSEGKENSDKVRIWGGDNG